MIRPLTDECFNEDIVTCPLRLAPETDIVSVRDLAPPCLPTPGVLLVIHQHADLQPIVESLLYVLGASAPKDWRDVVTYLPLWR